MLRVTPERVILTDQRVFRRPGGSAPRPGQRVVIDCRPGLMMQTPTHQPGGGHTDEPVFIPPAQPDDPLPLPLPPLVIRRVRPHAPLLADRDGLMSLTMYPAETGEGFRTEWPLKKKMMPSPPLALDEVDLSDTHENVPRIDHYALRDRDGLQHPYAAGIDHGRRYVRVLDIPVASSRFFHRREADKWLPFESGVMWMDPDNAYIAYSSNSTFHINLSSFIPRERFVDYGQPQTYHGHDVYLGEIVNNLITGLSWRELHQVALDPVDIAVVRHYEDGTTFTEAPMPGIEMTINPPSWPEGNREGDAWVAINHGGSRAGAGAIPAYQSGRYETDSVNTYWSEFAGSQYYWLNANVRNTSTAQTYQPTDLVVNWANVYEAYFLQSLTLPDEPEDDQPPIQPDGHLPERFKVKARLIRSEGGDVLPWDVTADIIENVNHGRVVYEGDLGTLPAPRSRITRTWCDIDVNAQGDFTADAWIDDKGVRQAIVVYADGLVVGSSKKRGGAPKIWTSTLAKLWPEAPDLTGWTPILSYIFMVDDWPFGAGSLAWSRVSDDWKTAQVMNARVRRDVGRNKVRIVTDRMTQTPIRRGIGDSLHRQNLLPVDRYLKPVAVSGIEDTKLRALQAPGPYEKDFRRVKWVSVGGPLTLNFDPPADSDLADEQIDKHLSEIEFVMPVGQVARFEEPVGWEKHVTRLQGRSGAIVRLVIPAAEQTANRIVLSFPDGTRMAHPRARLRLSTPEGAIHV